MPKVMQEELALLASSKHGLIYLTPNDWALIADKATRVRFKKGEILMHRGKRAAGIFVLISGTARVQIPSQRRTRAITAGEICGEMSFLEDAAVSAQVVADDEVEAFHLNYPTLQGLFELFPHLGSRFYRSLATNLSRRLRSLIGPELEAPALVSKTDPAKGAL